MSFLNRLPWRRVASGDATPSEERLSEAETLLRSGGRVEEIRAIVDPIEGHNDVERAWRALLLGDLEGALAQAYATASERPYDVDSRIVHGTVRLARNELQHADHEFDAVIEEFGAEADATDGRRAVILAHGFAPLDELPASEADWESAARLLTTLWRLSDLSDTRMSTLAHGHPEGLAIVRRALAEGQLKDSEGEDGSV